MAGNSGTSSMQPVCLVKLDHVKAETNFIQTISSLREMRPEFRYMDNLESFCESDFISHYAAALYYVMNSCRKCDRHKYIKRPGDEGFVDGMKHMERESKMAEEKRLQIQHLPVEDTVWFLDKVIDDTDASVDSSLLCLYIQDRTSLVIGFTVWEKSTNSTLSHLVYLTLCAACLSPKIHRARRPKYFCIRDHQLLTSCTLNLDSLGITYIGHAIPQIRGQALSSLPPENSCVGEEVLFRECPCCQFRAERQMFTTCGDCGAMLYCSDACQQTDRGQEGQLSLYSHRKWCHRLKAYMDEENQLVDLPFTFKTETTSPEFSVYKYRAFLQRVAAYGEGLWYWCCPPTTLTHTHGACFFEPQENPYVLAEEAALLQRSPTWCSRGEPLGGTCTPITDWATYYHWRGFNLDSPIAVLLHWPLTVYHILTCLQQDYGRTLAEDRPVLIDLLGVEQEVDMYPVFQELSHLLPAHEFVISMFGKNISKVVDRGVKVMERVKVKVYRCLYHNYKHQRPPDVAIGFNAGLAAYPSWRKTIEKLKDNQTPAYFTDYCHYSADLGREVVRDGCGVDTSLPVINPFRSPVRRICDQHLLPWFSNAFIFHLCYLPNKSAG